MPKFSRIPVADISSYPTRDWSIVKNALFERMKTNGELLRESLSWSSIDLIAVDLPFAKRRRALPNNVSTQTEICELKCRLNQLISVN